MNTQETTEEPVCTDCPLFGLEGFYSAKEVTAIDTTAPIDPDVMLFHNGTIYVPTLDTLGNLTLTSNYVGGRPPRRPIKTIE